MSRAWLALCACVALADPVSAQQAAAVSGNVRADTGLGLEGVAVSVVDRTTGSQRAAETTEDGRYVISGLPADGTYVVRAELSGFLPAVRENVTLVAGTTLTLDFQLNFATAETVDVNRPLLASGRSLLQQRLGDELIHSLPLLQRNFIQLVSLAGGFSGPSDFPSPQGQRYWANNVVVDGATNFSKWRAAPRAFHSGYSLESIREVQVLTNRFSAQYGEALASVTNVVTRAGTDEWRRTALLFLQDDVFNSTPAFASTKPPESSQQYGFSVPPKRHERQTTSSTTWR